MTYIQKKRIKLVALAIGVIILWIYLLGAMTSHAQIPRTFVEYRISAV